MIEGILRHKSVQSVLLFPAELRTSEYIHLLYKRLDSLAVGRLFKDFSVITKADYNSGDIGNHKAPAKYARITEGGRRGLRE